MLSAAQVQLQIGPNMAPKTAQTAPETAQKAPQTANKAPKPPQEALKTAQQSPKTPQEAPRRPNTLRSHGLNLKGLGPGILVCPRDGFL